MALHYVCNVIKLFSHELRISVYILDFATYEYHLPYDGTNRSIQNLGYD